MNIISKMQLIEADKLASLYVGEMRGNGYTPSKTKCVTSDKPFRVEFQNGVLNKTVLPVGRMADWAKLLPDNARIEMDFSPECQTGEYYHWGKVALKSGRSQITFQSWREYGLTGIESVPPIRFEDAGTAPDFHLVNPPDVGNLSDRLKAQKAGHKFFKLREVELKAARDLKGMARGQVSSLEIIAGGIDRRTRCPT